MQEDVTLTGSLADNISFFDVQPNQVRAEACARIARLHDDITRMRMGYQTLVGDLGSGLSGGKKQRLLLARALYKRCTPAPARQAPKPRCPGAFLIPARSMQPGRSIRVGRRLRFQHGAHALDGGRRVLVVHRHDEPQP